MNMQQCLCSLTTLLYGDGIVSRSGAVRKCSDNERISDYSVLDVARRLCHQRRLYGYNDADDSSDFQQRGGD